MHLRLITYNIRYATKHPVRGELPWAQRGPKLCEQLRFITAGHQSPFLCLQEALYGQVVDVQAQLGRGWAYIGRGRGERETDEEFSPIFYRHDCWKYVRKETRWLSPTPREPSRGWDAALNRIVTMGEFAHRVHGTRVVVLSTHLDHVGVTARRESAKLLLRFAGEWSSGEGGVAPAAVLMGGDLNSEPDGEAYQLMAAPTSGMSDAASLARKERHYGNELTYTSFGEPDERPSRIDFLFIKQTRPARVEHFGVLANSFDDKVLLSDHRAVVADIEVAL